MTEGFSTRVKRRCGWPLVGGCATLLLALWFATSAALVLWWRSSQQLNVSRIPIDVWSYIQALIFGVVGVQALRRRPRVQPWVLGGGAITVLLSGLAMRTNRWDAVGVGLGLVMVLAGLGWKVDD